MKEGYICIICGNMMSPTSEVVECSYCGKKENADYKCELNHYICEECRLLSAEKLVTKACTHLKEKDPTEIAELLMKQSAIQMHGPEHHYLTSCSLLATMRNDQLFNIDSSTIERGIKEIWDGRIQFWCGQGKLLR